MNEHQRLVDRTVGSGLDITNLGGRMPVWIDYDRDHLPGRGRDAVGRRAKVFHQLAGGGFQETGATAKLLCSRFQSAQLIDVNGDGRVDFLCADETKFPQKIYSTASFPWQSSIR